MQELGIFSLENLFLFGASLRTSRQSVNSPVWPCLDNNVGWILCLSLESIGRNIVTNKTLGYAWSRGAPPAAGESKSGSELISYPDKELPTCKKNHHFEKNLSQLKQSRLTTYVFHQTLTSVTYELSCFSSRGPGRRRSFVWQLLVSNTQSLKDMDEALSLCTPSLMIGPTERTMEE